MPYLAFVNHTTTIYSMEDDSVLKTINPGAAIAVFELDEEGRLSPALLAHHRLYQGGGCRPGSCRSRIGKPPKAAI